MHTPTAEEMALSPSRLHLKDRRTSYKGCMVLVSDCILPAMGRVKIATAIWNGFEYGQVFKASRYSTTFFFTLARAAFRRANRRNKKG